MEEMFADFSALKISALSKSIVVNAFVADTTIGPNSSNSVILNNASTRSNEKMKNLAPQNTNPSTPKFLHQQEGEKLIENGLSYFEKMRRKKVESAINLHKAKLLNFNKKQEALQKQQWNECQASKKREVEMQESLIMSAMQKIDAESTKEFDRSMARTRQRQQENILLLQEKAEKQIKLNKLHDKVKAIEHDLSVTVNEIERLIKNNQEAQSVVEKYLNDFKQLQATLNELKSRRELANIVENDAIQGESILNQARSLKDTLRKAIKGCYEKREKEAADKIKKQKEAEARSRDEQAKLAEAQKPAIIREEKPTGKQNNGNPLREEVLAFLQIHQANYKQLLDDNAWKQFKFDCKKAVNLPVNAISAVNPQHLTDKYIKLYHLLTGKQVKIADIYLVSSKHPQGIAFCMDLLAKKFVLQGDLTISSNPEAAFAYATVIVSLWNDFPDFGKLLLAHFYQQCPYLVPIHIQRQEGQSDEEYYTSLGYQYNDGQIEKQDKFLKRMTGISRLFFALMLTEPRRAQGKHPFGLKNAWSWFARTLNMLASIDVTSTIIHSFLEVLGNRMIEVYKCQFVKCINLLKRVQMPLLKEKDSGGPYARLDLLLQEYEKTKVFEKPEGMLHKNFW